MLLLLCLISIGSALSAHLPQCQRLCTAVYQPVCGSDGKTYSNSCAFAISQCEAHYAGKVISMKSSGACKQHGHGHGTTAKPNHHHTTTYRCGDHCNEEIPGPTFCASDLNTYDSKCIFTQAQCEAAAMNQSMYIIHTGSCAPMDADCPMMCDPTLAPVCSTGNHTYRNQCFLKQAYCTHNPNGKGANYTYAHNGSCDGSNVFQTRQVDCSQYELSGAVALETKGTLAIGACPTNSSYVCGTDYRTYRNECNLCRSMSDHQKVGKDKTVEVVHDGICPSYTRYHKPHIIFG